MRSIIAPLLVTLLSLGSVHAQNVKRTEDIIYGRKFGVSLTMDVFQPGQPNGYGVIWMVSGGFFSSKEAISPGFYKSLLDRGYTVFAVVHGSQPKFQIEEIEQVWWEDLMPECLWKFRVKDFGPLILAIDSHGNSRYRAIQERAAARIAAFEL